MAGTYKTYQTEEGLEKGGITLDLGEVGKFKLARAGGANSQFQKRMMVLTKPHRKSISAGIIDPKLADQLLAQAFAETVVLGWEGVTGPDGEPLAYNKENAVKLLTDLPDLFKDIRETSEDATLFRAVNLEDAAKN